MKYIPPKTAKSKKCRVMNAFVELVVSQYNQNGQQLSCGKFHTFATDAPLCFYLESEVSDWITIFKITQIALKRGIFAGKRIFRNFTVNESVYEL